MQIPPPSPDAADGARVQISKQFHLQLDEPADWTSQVRRLRISGWCVAKHGEPARRDPRATSRPDFSRLFRSRPSRRRARISIGRTRRAGAASRSTCACHSAAVVSSCKSRAPTGNGARPTREMSGGRPWRAGPAGNPGAKPRPRIGSGAFIFGSIAPSIGRSRCAICASPAGACRPRARKLPRYAVVVGR